MDIVTAQSIATIAAPLTKIVLDTFLVPKLQALSIKWKKDRDLSDHFFEDKFQDYLNESFEKNAILNTIAFKKKKVFLNDVYIPLNLYCPETNKEIKIETFDEQLFDEADKILITDTAGMGKSTLAKKLLVSCIEQNNGVPILIELRRLSRNKGIVDEIIEQLNPINETIDKQFILDLLKRGDFVFFLDGFDEIPILEKSFVTTEIQRFVSKAKKNRFVLTSRPEDSLTSFGEFQKLQIKPLELSEAFELLRKYDNYGNNSTLLISKLKETEVFDNIKEYLTTPLLVSLLFTAFEHKQKIPFKKHIFYRQVYDALFESHDLSKGDSFEREKYTNLGCDEFHRILRILGYLCLKSGNKIEFTRDELIDIIQNAINYCNNLDIKPSDFIKDLLITVPVFIKDGIYYKWSHKSLQEYFSAQFIYLDSKEKQKSILNHISFHKKNYTFINVIDLYMSMDPIGFENIVIYKFLTDFINHLDNTYRHFSGEAKIIRQQFTFTNDIYLVNYPLSKYNRSVSSLFRFIRKNVGDDSWGLRERKDEGKISYIKVAMFRNEYADLMYFLFRKELKFIYENKIKLYTKIIDLKLKKDKVYKVTDRKNSVLNQGENFNKTNELIKLFIFQPKPLFVNIEKAKSLIHEIDNRIKNKATDFLLDY